VELDHGDSQPGDASHFVERRLIVVGVDRCDWENLGCFAASAINSSFLRRVSTNVPRSRCLIAERGTGGDSTQER